MLNANPRQFFNYKMKGRRARIRNQKRSRHHRSWLDRSLDNYVLREEKIKQKEDSRLSEPKRPLFQTEGEARAYKKSAKEGLIFVIAVAVLVIIFF